MADTQIPANERSARPSLSLARGTAVVSSLTLLSRVLGFARDLLIARIFGASPIADAFFVAFRIPNLLRSFVAEGAMTSAFVPVFTDELQRSKAAANAALRSMLGMLLTITGALALLGILFAVPLIDLIAPGFARDPAQQALCVNLTRIMLPFVICVSLVALLNGALNTVGTFGAAAMAQVWMNVCLIVGAGLAQFLEAPAAASMLAFSVLAGGVVQVISQLPAMKRAGFQFLPSRTMFTPPVRRILLLMFPALIGAAVYQTGILLNTVFASTLEAGSISWLFYADRLVQLPVGIFSIALASVLLPTLSRAATNNDAQQFSQHLETSLRVTSFVVLPVSCGLYLFSQPLVELAFERGAFSSSATLRTAEAIQAYCFGIWAMSMYSMLSRGFIAKKNTILPTAIGLTSLLVVLIGSIALMGAPVNQERTSSSIVSMLVSAQIAFADLGIAWSLGHVGLAAASSLGAWTSLILACALISRRASLRWALIASSAFKALAAGLVACWIPLWALQGSSAFTSVLVGAPTAVALYLLISSLLKSEELLSLSKLGSKLLPRTRIVDTKNDDPSS